MKKGRLNRETDGLAVFPAVNHCFTSRKHHGSGLSFDCAHPLSALPAAGFFSGVLRMRGHGKGRLKRVSDGLFLWVLLDFVCMVPYNYRCWAAQETGTPLPKQGHLTGDKDEYSNYSLYLLGSSDAAGCCQRLLTKTGGVCSPACHYLTKPCFRKQAMTAKTQIERSKKYFEKHGIVQKKFNLDADTVALLERLAAERG